MVLGTYSQLELSLRPICPQCWTSLEMDSLLEGLLPCTPAPWCPRHLQGSKHHHLLFSAVNLLCQQVPTGLFIQLGQPDRVCLEQREVRWFS